MSPPVRLEFENMEGCNLKHVQAENLCALEQYNQEDPQGK